MKRRAGTWVNDQPMREREHGTPGETASRAQRKGIRRTVAITVAIALVFYSILIVQILIAKFH